jgi:ArsR family transcriptional regulator, arsenate/arsenite/antimonite-responsive transcriptional repressor
MAKVELFTKELQDTALFFKSLGHPARLAILKYLAETRVCMTGNISDHLPLSRTTVNQHLKELKDLNLINGEIEGAKVNYCINKDSIVKVKAILESFLDDIKCC